MKTEDRTIGGFKYRMTQMGGISGKDIALILLRPFTTLLEGAASGGLAGVTKEKLVMSAVTSGSLTKAIALLSKEDLAAVCDAFAAQTTVWVKDGTKLRDFPLATIFDDHFAGRYSEMLQWLAWGVSLNGFFDGVLRHLSAGEASPSPSPTGSTTGAGDSSPVPTA